jgi:hypothetical protein
MHPSSCTALARIVAWISPLAFAAALLTACQASTAKRERTMAAAPRPALINHLAFFRLKNPQDAAELIADCDASLGTIPQVVAYFCGRHLDTGRGERIDSDYDVGFYVGFLSQADYTTYVEHPRHKEMLAKWQPRWEWIRVIDVADTTP